MRSGSDPRYLQVLEDLRAQIRDGMLAPGARVPSRNVIMTRYGVGETAAKHALQVLATEGLIEPRAGSGSYVRRPPATCHLEHDRPHFPGSPFGLAEAALPGDGPGPAGSAATAAGRARRASPLVSWEHQTERVPAPPHLARRLGLAGRPLVTRTRYLLSADGSPVQVATSYEPSAMTARTHIGFPEEGPYAGRGVVERMRSIGVAVDEVVEDIGARPSLAHEAAALRIPPGAPVLVVEREHRAAGRAVELTEIVIPAEGFRLRYRAAVTGLATAGPQSGTTAGNRSPRAAPGAPPPPPGSRTRAPRVPSPADLPA